MQVFFAADHHTSQGLRIHIKGRTGTPFELFCCLLDRRQVTQIQFDEMDVVLSSFFLKFLNGSIRFRLGPSEDVYFCILGEKLLENKSALGRSSLLEKVSLSDLRAFLANTWSGCAIR